MQQSVLGTSDESFGPSTQRIILKITEICNVFFERGIFYTFLGQLLEYRKSLRTSLVFILIDRQKYSVQLDEYETVLYFFY